MEFWKLDEEFSFLFKTNQICYNKLRVSEMFVLCRNPMYAWVWSIYFWIRRIAGYFKLMPPHEPILGQVEAERG